jgi:hypothetical protein
MRLTLVPILVALVLSACSSAPPASSGPDIASAGPSSSPGSSASAVPTAAPTSAPSANPSQVAVGRAPSGPWSSIRWIDAGRLPLGPAEVTVRGWSGGYVALEQSPGSDDEGNELPVTIRTAASADGLQWSAPTTLETGFKGQIAISTVVEGPRGLLALAYPYGDTCGGTEPVVAMWGSRDGAKWERIPMPKAFGSNAVETISGGGAGFIALGHKSGSSTSAIWTSQDGRGWTARKLPTVSSGTLVLDSAASFAGGFVLAGAVLGEDGCGGPAHIRPAVWFSPDGGSWTRTTLPGALTDPNSAMKLRASPGRVVVMQIPSGDAKTAPSWATTDGRTWSAGGALPVDAVWASFTDGVHSIISILPDSGAGLPALTELQDSGSVTPIRQDAGVGVAGPVASEDDPGFLYALGPTGLLAVRSDGEASWLGIPS